MQIQKNISLKEFSNIKIGGPAKFFTEAESKEDIVDAIKWAKDNGEKFYMLGVGANTVFSDEGYDGLIIYQNNRSFEIEDEFVYAESGVVFEDLIEATLDSNLIGIHRFAGIPSTIGGACFINLHYYKDLMSNLVHSAEIFDVEKDEIFEVNVDWFNYKYEDSKLQEKSSLVNSSGNSKYVLLSCDLKLNKVSDEEKWFAKGVASEIALTRSYKYPQEPSVGSVFQNLPPSAKEFYGAPTLSAGYYIDRCGLKGSRVGGIEVSGRHANIFINKNSDGTCQDLLDLIDLVKEKVKAEFGIELKKEIRIVS